MKTIISAGLWLALTVVALGVAGAQVGPRVVINGLQLQAPAMLLGDHTMVPMRAVFEALQSDVQWDGSTRQITARRADKVVQMWIGRGVATVNGQELPLSAPPILIGDSTYVPLRFPTEAFGGEVSWNDALQTATITIAPLGGYIPTPVPAPAQAPTLIPTPTPVPTPEPIPAPAPEPTIVPTPSPAPYAPSVGVYVELCRPQSDDQGHYVAMSSDDAVSVIGSVSAVRGVTAVSVNGVPAVLSPTAYVPFGTPMGVPSLQFMAQADLESATPLTVMVTDGSGTQSQAVFLPDSGTTLARLSYLRQEAEAAQLSVEARRERHEWNELRYANACAADHRYAEAGPLYQHFIEVEPAIAVGPFLFGIALSSDGRYDEAIEQHRRCLQAKPDFFFAQFEIGRCHQEQGHHDEAVATLSKVVAEHPAFLGARYRLGQSLAVQGRHEEAVAQLRTVAAQTPRLAAVHHALAETLSQQGKLGDATTEYQKAVVLAPRNATIRTHLGDALLKQHNAAAATVQYQQAVKTSPAHVSAHTGLAQSLYASGKYAEAWNAVHAGEKTGAKFTPEFLESLRQKMPETPQPAVASPRRRG